MIRDSDMSAMPIHIFANSSSCQQAMALIQVHIFTINFIYRLGESHNKAKDLYPLKVIII